MGLDMYLQGRKAVSSRYDPENEQVKEDGFVVKSMTLDLGYWRKHPQLHGFIVDEFANGVDECQEIRLENESLEKIIQAIENDSIYEDEVNGFFFGRSAFPGEEYFNEQKTEDLEIFRKALEWVKAAPRGEWRDVYYEASW